MMPAPDRKGGERQAIQTQRLDQKIYNCPCPNRSSATQLGAIWPASSVMIITGTSSAPRWINRELVGLVRGEARAANPGGSCSSQRGRL